MCNLCDRNQSVGRLSHVFSLYKLLLLHLFTYKSHCTQYSRARALRHAWTHSMAARSIYCVVHFILLFRRVVVISLILMRRAQNRFMFEQLHFSCCCCCHRCFCEWFSSRCVFINSVVTSCDVNCTNRSLSIRHDFVMTMNCCDHVWNTKCYRWHAICHCVQRKWWWWTWNGFADRRR